MGWSRQHDAKNQTRSTSDRSTYDGEYDQKRMEDGVRSSWSTNQHLALVRVWKDRSDQSVTTLIEPGQLQFCCTGRAPVTKCAWSSGGKEGDNLQGCRLVSLGSRLLNLMSRGSSG